MNKDETNKEIALTLERIAGTQLPDGFGEPFTAVFEKFYPGRCDETMAAGFICSLFLSCILAGFSNTKMYTFVHFANENCGRFSFNCKMYETIFENMGSNAHREMALLDNNGHSCSRKCDKKDIFDALDFYTNR